MIVVLTNARCDMMVTGILKSALAIALMSTLSSVAVLLAYAISW